MFRLSKGFGHAALKASVRRNAVCCFVTANRLQQACAVVSYGRGRGLKTVQSIQQESIRKPSETSGEIPYSSVEKDQQNRKRIKKIIQKRNYGEIINAMHEARAHNTDLDMVDYVAGIDACVLRASFTGSEIAFWIYQKLKAESVIPAEVYIKLLCLCRQLEDVDKAVEIAEEFTSSGYTMSNSFLTELILNLCYVDSNNRHGIQALTYYYEESKRLKAEFGFHTSADVYMKVATAFCRVVESQKSLQVLRDMTEANHEPTAALCQDLLEMSLFTMDEVLLRVLASWYKNNFTDAKLEYGVLNRMIQVAASKGDGQLAQVTFQLINKNGYNPSFNNYVSVVRACLLDNDIISAVEALEEMQFLWTSNHSMNEGYNQQLVQYESIKDLMAAVLVQQQNTAMIDELYFALVDQVRRGQNVPRIALDAIVEAAGRMDLFDRAFATFQEYGPIFRIQPDIHSHNSLLSSCVSGTRVNMHTLLAIFQDIENTVRSDGTAVQPNSTSYSLLLEAMVDTDDFRVFDDVLKQMIAANIRPSSRSLRRCIIAFALKGNWVMVDALSDHLVYLQNGRPLPAFLSIRLKAIRNRT